LIVAVDAGKYATKAMAEGDARRFIVRTKMDDGRYSMISFGNTYTILFEGRKYTFGDEAIGSDFDTSKTKLVHKIAAYTALSVLADGKEVDLAIGCPMSQYYDQAAKDEYAQFMQGSRHNKIIINDTTRSFAINSVKVFPESVGVVIENAPELRNRVIGVIDIGGLNINGAIYDHLTPQMQSIFTINEGAEIMQAKVERELNSRLMANYQDYEIKYVMTGDNAKAKAIMTEVLREQAERVYRECKRRNWNLSDVPVLFTGGGSILLADRLRDQFPKSILSKNAVWDNAYGFYKLKEMFK
jgi:plasmid segregation protein ParM